MFPEVSLLLYSLQREHAGFFTADNNLLILILPYSQIAFLLLFVSSHDTFMHPFLFPDPLIISLQQLKCMNLSCRMQAYIQGSAVILAYCKGRVVVSFHTYI